MRLKRLGSSNVLAKTGAPQVRLARFEPKGVL